MTRSRFFSKAEGEEEPLNFIEVVLSEVSRAATESKQYLANQASQEKQATLFIGGGGLDTCTCALSLGVMENPAERKLILDKVLKQDEIDSQAIRALGMALYGALSTERPAIQEQLFERAVKFKENQNSESIPHFRRAFSIMMDTGKAEKKESLCQDLAKLVDTNAQSKDFSTLIVPSLFAIVTRLQNPNDARLFLPPCKKITDAHQDHAETVNLLLAELLEKKLVTAHELRQQGLLCTSTLLFSDEKSKATYCLAKLTHHEAVPETFFPKHGDVERKRAIFYLSSYFDEALKRQDREGIEAMASQLVTYVRRRDLLEHPEAICVDIYPFLARIYFAVNADLQEQINMALLNLFKHSPSGQFMMGSEIALLEEIRCNLFDTFTTIISHLPSPQEQGLLLSRMREAMSTIAFSEHDSREMWDKDFIAQSYHHLQGQLSQEYKAEVIRVANMVPELAELVRQYLGFGLRR